MSASRKAFKLLLNLGRIAVQKPRRLSHVLGTALAASEEVAAPDCDLLALPQVTVEELQPKTNPLRITLEMFPGTAASISPFEFICLIVLLKKAAARSVFEFGTYKGVSITQLALNLPDSARIHTLDLPEQPVQTNYAISDPEDAAIAREPGKGSLVPEALKPRIHFLKQDSAQFDETPYHGSMDLIFVDGAHNADYVRNDSEKGWRMLRSGGILAWHDCRAADPDVVRYLLNCSYQPIRIVGTTLAFATKS